MNIKGTPFINTETVMQRFEVKCKKDRDGNCIVNKSSARMCGYCTNCTYLAKAWDEAGLGTETDFQEKNFIWCEQERLKDANMRRALQEKIYCDVNGAPTAPPTSKWITISFPKDYNLRELRERTELLQAKGHSSCGDSIAVYEYFSEQSKEGGNLHVHLLSAQQSTYKLKVLKTRIGNHYKIKDNFITVDFLRGDKFFEKLKYVLGEKQHSKKEYVIKDNDWRNSNDFPRFSNFFHENTIQKYKIELPIL